MTEPILKYDKKESIGYVNSVDTGLASVIVNDDAILSQLQINQLLAVQSPKSGRYIIAMIIKIYRKAAAFIAPNEEEVDEDLQSAFNQVRLVFVGEFIERYSDQKNVFHRNVSAVPSIDALCYKIEGEKLTNLMPDHF